ncbi:hypothetical protein R3I93_003933 [Phoxinus phoxinus]|uniref:Uncharacterized protein n=1 Tax=Phoxinus phoxinus TaxID=58324 RepID=A0AAN9DE80_9TELE
MDLIKVLRKDHIRQIPVFCP